MPNKKLIFTICARNYYGLTKVLKRSIEAWNPGVEFFVFIADGIPMHEHDAFGSDAIDATVALKSYIGNEKLVEMAFKYNLTEFCTAIKPFCFQYLFNTADVNQIIYLDPDVFVFSSMTPIFEKLVIASIVVTPHILFPSSMEGKRSDKGIMATGIFNLGFIGLRRSEIGRSFANWWGQRLLDQCFVDNYDALFTDQKWVDFLPALFPAEDICVLRHVGTNLAPWNFHERQAFSDTNGRLFVKRRLDPDEKIFLDKNRLPEPLIFVHFSGFDYKGLCNGLIAQNNIDGLKIYPDLQPLVDQYMLAIKSQKDAVLKFLDLHYLYATFQDGSLVAAFHRRLYRSAVESGLSVGNPFVTGAGSFHQKLAESRLLVKQSKIAQVDKSNKFNLSGIGFKLSLFNKGMRFLLRIIGTHNYLLLLRLMRPYSRAESQLHLIDPAKVKL